MTLHEKVLYHQIHPMKLFTDWSTGVLSFYLLWQHSLRQAILVMFIPAIVVSGALIWLADLEPRKQSPLGRYVAKYMTPSMQEARFAGNAVMALGAWYRRPAVLVAGLLVILFGWLRGALVQQIAVHRGHDRRKSQGNA